MDDLGVVVFFIFMVALVFIAGIAYALTHGPIHP